MAPIHPYDKNHQHGHSRDGPYLESLASYIDDDDVSTMDWSVLLEQRYVIGVVAVLWGAAGRSV